MLMAQSSFADKLDSPSFIREIDSQNMLSALEGFPEQCREAVEIARKAAIPAGFARGVSNLFVAGMGGSGIGGDLFRVVIEDEVALPLQVVKGYRLPGYVGPDSLLIAVSYSGNTEETLNCFREALSRQAKIICLTSGGKLAAEGERNNLPVVKIPGGLQPRAALGYLFLPLLVILSRLGLASFDDRQLAEAVALLNQAKARFSQRSSFPENQAKQIAARLYGKAPVIYGSEGLAGVAALRWKCQFNENSKIPAFCHSFPELNHNELVGWEKLANLTKSFSLILLRDKDESARMRTRIEVTKELIKGAFDEAVEVWAEGRSPLAKTLSLIYLGDYISFYLAILNGVDPSPVEKIAFLKEKLAGVEGD